MERAMQQTLLTTDLVDEIVPKTSSSRIRRIAHACAGTVGNICLAAIVVGIIVVMNIAALLQK